MFFAGGKIDYLYFNISLIILDKAVHARRMKAQELCVLIQKVWFSLMHPGLLLWSEVNENQLLTTGVAFLREPIPVGGTYEGNTRN
jgi:hypothetical protein